MKLSKKQRKMMKKGISKIWIAIFVLLFATIFLFLFSEKVHKIGIVESIKGQVILLSEQIQNTLFNQNRNNEMTVIDVTNLIKGKETEHEHLWKTMYDENSHWKECMACGEVNEETIHIYTTTWALGYESCHYTNYCTKTCSCGYSTIWYRPCVWDGKSYISGSGNCHSRKCKVCASYIMHEYYLNNYGNGQLYNIETTRTYPYENDNIAINYAEWCHLSNGTILNCSKSGTCSKCTSRIVTNLHIIDSDIETGRLYCRLCSKEFGTVTHTITHDSNTPPTYTIVDNIILKNGATFNSNSGIPTVNLATKKQNIVKNSSTNITITSTIKAGTVYKTPLSIRRDSYVNISGVKCLMDIYSLISPDLVAPQIASIRSDNDSSLVEWSRTKPIVIEGTENYCNTVKVQIIDDEEKTVFSGETIVTNGKYSISSTPEIEAGLTGRIFKSVVTDTCNNSTIQEFTISKVDSIAPEATSGNEILGDWAKSKDFTFTATDKGIGEVQIAFNDVNDYQLAREIGNNTYSREYKFVGDAYIPTEAVVFFKDELGNISTQTITIDKIDNTAPTITAVNINGNIISITANDEHKDLGEGSGVIGYRYIISDNKIVNPVITAENSILVSGKTTGEGNFIIDNLYNDQYIYIAAVDAVGNIGDAKEIFEPIIYTIKYNGNGETSGVMNNNTCIYDEPESLTPNEFERNYKVIYDHNYEGSKNKEESVTYRFKNWNTKEDGTGKSFNDKEEVLNLTTKAGEVINLYAIWEIEPISYEPIREGYCFGGWYLDEECTKKVANIEYIPTKDVTLYAKWEKEYTITVDNDREGHTYNSYQIFQGDYYEKEEKILDENNEEKVVKVPILSNIEWSSELQKEISTDNEKDEGKTHGDKIIEILKDKNTELYKDCKTAEDVAKVLEGKPNDGEVIKEFTNIVGKYILDNDIPITKGTNKVVEDKDESGKEDLNYKIQYLKPGYYIVVDADVKEKEDSYSRFLIDVVQDVTMEPKSSIPKLNKRVIGNNIKTQVEGSEENPVQYVDDEKRNTATYKKEAEEYNAEDYDIEFELKSCIPDIEGYSTYKFEVVDILAKGFDYDRNSINVMLGSIEYPKTREKIVEGNNETGEDDRVEIINNYTIRDIVITAKSYETYKTYFEEEGKEYLDGYAESQYGKTLILVELNDLVEQLEDGIVEKGQDVIITYNSKLNGKGEVGITPNINEAYLKYSNNPNNSESITQTTTQITYTYTIDLDLSKIAELKSETDEKTYLSGAKFEIYNSPKTDGDREPIAAITTDELGQALYSSLGVGTYYLKEVKSPEGYNKLREEIEIEIKAECDEFGTITWTVEEKTNNNLVLVQMGEKEVTGIPEIKLQVENTTGFQLPVTGGIGTVIFTIIGLSLMLVAIVTLKLNKIKTKIKFTHTNNNLYKH